MAELVPVEVNGQTFYVEAAPSYGVEETTVEDKVVEGTEHAFDRAKNTITAIAGSLVAAVRAMDDNLTPAEFSFEFGITFTAKGAVVLASVEAETNLKVTMTYKHK